MSHSSEPVYLASCAFTENEDLYALCVKSSKRPELVLPLLCPRGIAGHVLVAQKGALPKDVIYGVLNDVLQRDGWYISGVELVANAADPTRMVAQIIRVNDSFQQDAVAINPADGVIFAYVNEHQLFIASDLAEFFFTRADGYFTDRVSADEFRNDHLLNRRK